MKNNPTHPNPAPERIDGLVVMRESAMYDELLMEGMVSQTLAKVRHLPGASDLEAAGMDVIRNPEKYGASVRRIGKSRLVTLERNGVIYLYSMGSAAAADVDDENAFVQELVKLIVRFSPREVWATSFTRLVRAAEHAGALLQAVTGHVDVIRAEQDIEPHTTNGKLMFQVLTMIASAERDYIIQRHTLGRVAQCKQGRWIPASGYPPGYEIDRDGRLQLADSSTVAQVRRALRILANPNLTSGDIANRLDALGLSTPMIRSRHGADAGFADARNPSQAVRTVRKWGEAMRTGRYEMYWPNPFPGVTDFAGMEVEPHPDLASYPNGALRLELNLPLPEGGWADDATFASIAQLANRPGNRGGSTHRHTPPLSMMFRYRLDDSEYALMCRDGYTLRRRPFDPERRHDGWEHEGTRDDMMVARMDRDDLHKSIATGITAAVRNGIPAELRHGYFLPTDELPPIDAAAARRRAITTQLEEANRRLQRAEHGYLSEQDNKIGERMLEQMKLCQAEIDRLDAELAEIEATDSTPTLAPTFESSADMVAHAIAALAVAGDTTSRSVRDALATVLTDCRFRPSERIVEWSVKLRVPHRNGTVILGPITGTVPNLHRPRTGALEERHRQKRREVSNQLEISGLDRLPARVAASCAHPIVWSCFASGTANPDVDPRWVEHIVEVYTASDFRWSPHLWRHETAERQQIYDFLAGKGGSASVDEVIDGGFAEHQLRYLTKTRTEPAGRPTLTATGRGPKRRYSLLECAHCHGHASLACRTPETQPGVLCPKCMRTPDPESPVFPDIYRG